MHGYQLQKFTLEQSSPNINEDQMQAIFVSFLVNTSQLSTDIKMPSTNFVCDSPPGILITLPNITYVYLVLSGDVSLQKKMQIQLTKIFIK